jgi:hypothetical protein
MRKDPLGRQERVTQICIIVAKPATIQERVLKEDQSQPMPLIPQSKCTLSLLHSQIPSLNYAKNALSG